MDRDNPPVQIRGVIGPSWHPPADFEPADGSAYAFATIGVEAGKALVAADALDHLNRGITVVDCACRMRFANRRARAMLEEFDGLSLWRGELAGSVFPDGTPLRMALRRSLSSGCSSALRLQRPSGKRPWSVLITPLRLTTAPRSSAVSAAMLCVTDADRLEAPTAARLMQFYGLTTAEATLTRLLLRGRDMAESSVQLGISIQTARTHLRSILSKTDTHRQSELVRLALQELGEVI